METITTTNSATGEITRVTVLHPYAHYLLPALGLVAFLLVVWGLRKIFWQKDSD
jgi:hypothetical protein